MELREYWIILKRWRWVTLLPAIVIVGIGLATYSPVPPTYTATVRLSAGLPPSAGAAGSPDHAYFDPAYYAWMTSEYLVASLSDWARTGAFAQAVSTELDAQGINLTQAAVYRGLTSDYVRSQLVLYFNAGSPEHIIDTSRAAIKVLQTQNATAFPQLGGQNAKVIQLDEPAVTSEPVFLRSLIDLGMRVVVGVGVGVMLAFLSHYLDPMLRTGEDVERLHLRVIAQIPPAEGP